MVTSVGGGWLRSAAAASHPDGGRAARGSGPYSAFGAGRGVCPFEATVTPRGTISRRYLPPVSGLHLATLLRRICAQLDKAGVTTSPGGRRVLRESAPYEGAHERSSARAAFARGAELVRNERRSSAPSRSLARRAGGCAALRSSPGFRARANRGASREPNAGSLPLEPPKSRRPVLGSPPPIPDGLGGGLPHLSARRGGWTPSDRPHVVRGRRPASANGSQCQVGHAASGTSPAAYPLRSTRSAHA